MRSTEKKHAEDKNEGKNEGGKVGGFTRKVLFFLFTVLTAAVLFLTALFMHDFDAGDAVSRHSAADFEVTEDVPEVSAIIPGESGDIGELRRICGFPLPYFAGQIMYGEAANAVYDGKKAVTVTMEYQSGVVIRAVRPAAAAPLIRFRGMETAAGNALRIPFAGMSGGIDALMCRGTEGACLIFHTSDAAYAVFAPVDGETLYKYLSENSLSVR